MISIMVKATKKNVHAPLITIGYLLFSLLIVATLLSTTIPFGRMLFDPRVLHFNVAVSAIALTIGAILPALLGYIIGSQSVKSRSKASHHFSGILFGLLGYWLMTSWAMLIMIPSELFSDQNVRITLINLLPGICVAIITTILAVAHVRSRQAKQDVLEYKPFSVLLIASILVMPLWSLVNNIATNSINVYSFVSLAIVVVLGAISYVSLRKVKLSRYSKMVWSAVSVSIAFVAMYVSFQLVYSIATYLNATPTMETQSVVSGVGFILGLVGWIVYWSKQVRTLR